jgi:SAM-dependent methyltransferase
MGLLEQNRRAIDSHDSVRRWFSPALFGLESLLRSRLRQVARGDLLDVGCGDMPYRPVVSGLVTVYHGLDIEPRSVEVQYVGSATDMSQVPDAHYDTVLCSEVLEHVDRPRDALGEIARVLRPGGRLILTAPFLSRLHEEPRDFYRYTRYGLAQLMKDAGLELEQLTEYGSIASFIGHQVSTVLMGTTWHLPVLKWIVFSVNVGLVVLPALAIDWLAGPLRRKMPVGYVVVARSPR